MTPWDLVKRSEHSHQRAVFAWANCAAMYGVGVADSPLGYALDTRPALMTTLNAVWETTAHIGYHPCLPRPELSRLFAVHNQGHGDVIRGAQAKAEGVKAGVPDMLLPMVKATSPGRWPTQQGFWVGDTCFNAGLFIELKRSKIKGKAQAGAESDIQAEWRAYLTDQGYVCVVATGWQEAVAAIKGYLL